MPVFNLSALLYNLKNGQLREFDASKFEKVVNLKEGARLQLDAPLVSSLALPDGRLACVTNSTFQIFDLSTNICVSQFNFSLFFNEGSQQERNYGSQHHPTLAGFHLLPGGDKVLICGVTRSGDYGSTQVWDIVNKRCLLKTPEGPHVLKTDQAAMEVYMQSGWFLPSSGRYSAQSNATVSPNYLSTISNNSLFGSRGPSLAQTLRTIDFELGPLEQHDVLPLLEAMIHTSDVLKHLSLKRIKLNEVGLRPLLKLIETNTHLKSLNLEETSLTDEQIALIKNAWAQKNRPMKQLIFSQNASELSSIIMSLSQFPQELKYKRTNEEALKESQLEELQEKVRLLSEGNKQLSQENKQLKTELAHLHGPINAKKQPPQNNNNPTSHTTMRNKVPSIPSIPRGSSGPGIFQSSLPRRPDVQLPQTTQVDATLQRNTNNLPTKKGNVGAMKAMFENNSNQPPSPGGQYPTKKF